MSDDRKFWLVWCPPGEWPLGHRHSTAASAVAEAERLATAHPGNEFIVLGAVESRLMDSMRRTVYLHPDEERPF